ncbi:caspase family protein [Loktanella sp. M215]|uniref:caspase family protein n=1 Tax=Loktanella sp. M215 TaxID=2675431 RepID=UPI001F1C15D3|nr:caspase family protein [Loktanella sp. M215]MCF7699914.1 peptidase C14, caspase catalytic subunit p20 [Loktanella sp. M215]
MLRLLAGLTLCLTWLTAAQAEERVAFIVGNSAYQTVGELENPVNDASDIAIALEGLGFKVLLGRNLTHDQMVAMAGQFGDLAAMSDVALFYYAGHGFQVDATNYLIPIDAAIATPADVAGETIALQAILNAMDRAPGLKLVMLDACRDNPFGAAMASDPRLGNGLARVGTEANFMFVYATQPDNVAYDGTGRNSFFTEAMLSHIYTPGQDISDLLINVRRDVLAATGGKQIPWDNSSLTRQFRFDTAPPTASEETLLWQVAASAKDPQLMDLYVQRYPEGTHTGDVMAFLDQQKTSATRTLGTAGVDTAAQADRLWALARRTRMRPLLEFYLQKYPDGADAGAAQELLATLPSPNDASPGSVCERLATHPRDATATNAGTPFETLQRNALTAIQACSAAVIQAPDLPHYVALLARATAAGGDLGRAVELYQQASDQGDLRAMVSLAQLYDSGNGVPQDPAIALALYERAAAGGSPDALINLAVSLLQGQGVPKDPDRAIGLLRRASAEGSAKATFNLGVLAQEGQVDTPAAALAYFERAATGGEVGAYRAAAILLDEGRGVIKDPDAAANMLLRGAAEDSGEINAMLQASAGEWTPATLMAIQTRLKAAGFYTKAIDGVPGPSLMAALADWRGGGFDASVLTP